MRAGAAVVFHADDFGMNRSVTQGIIRGFTHGLLTSTSVLANAPDAPSALGAWRLLEGQRASGRLPSGEARLALREPPYSFELGIHLNLTQGRPLTPRYPPQLLDEAGCFCGIVRLFSHLHRSRPSLETALRAELSAQIAFLVDHGLRPTHLNGHQYVELLPGLRSSLRSLMVHYGIQTVRVARESGLTRTTVLGGLELRNWAVAHAKRFYAGRFLHDTKRWKVRFPTAFFGTSHAGRIDLRLVRKFLSCANGSALIEIGLHPAIGCADLEEKIAPGWDDPLARNRPNELVLLTSTDLVNLLHSHGLSLGRLSQSAMTAAARAA